jgi:hypothetical protein
MMRLSAARVAQRFAARDEDDELVESVGRQVAKALKSGRGDWDLDLEDYEVDGKSGRGWWSVEWSGTVNFVWEFPVKELKGIDPDSDLAEQILEEAADEMATFFLREDRTVLEDLKSLIPGIDTLWKGEEGFPWNGDRLTEMVDGEPTEYELDSRRGLLQLKGSMSFEGGDEDVDEDMARGRY